MSYIETNKKRELEVGKRKRKVGGPGTVRFYRTTLGKYIYNGNYSFGIHVCLLWGKWADTCSQVQIVQDVLVCYGRKSPRAGRGLLKPYVEVRKGCLGLQSVCTRDPSR